MNTRNLVAAAVLAALPAGMMSAESRPLYPDATYSGESFTVENSRMRLVIHKRLTGWGWVEIFDEAGKMIAVLDHFGEVSPIGKGRVFPLRVEAQQYRLDKGSFGQRVTFPVTMRWYATMAETRWNESPWNEPHLEGTVTLTLEPDAARVKLAYDYRPLKDFSARYIRGPWLKVGAGSFGAAKTDGIFPGVEWLRGNEWSSGTDFMQHPHALRVVPHPFKVAAPLMAISHEETAIALSWNPLAPVLSGKRYLQPVYASPNFIDRVNNQLLGLILPSVAWGVEENTLPVHTAKETPAVELRPGAPIQVEAEIFLVKGNSLHALVDWVKRHGLPEPSKPRYPLREALDRIARAYNTHFWHEGRGWGRTAKLANPSPPSFIERYVKEGSGRATADALAQKLAWARQQPGYRGGGRAGLNRFARWSRDEQLSHGRDLLAQQRADGSFPYEPDGRHKNDLIRIAASLHKPLGKTGDTGLDLNMQPAIDLLILAELTGEEPFRSGARKALEYSMRFERPDGGDWWETPLPSANLLAAGDGAIAYYLGYKAFNNRGYLEKSVYWLRSLLAFTHLWQPEEVIELYNTKPCLNETMYYGSSWVNQHVQWEVLRVFAQSTDLGIDWRKVDPEIDWHRYQKGVTVAVLRWMVDHKDTSHPGTPPGPEADLVKRGLADTLFYDVHDAVTGAYRGALIEPPTIATNLYAVLDRE